ncbi:MAG: hypothetical protein ACHQ1G_06635, partial [Planctomycetota bacterium]
RTAEPMPAATADAADVATMPEAPAEEVAGARRADGTIVGGASWAPMTRMLAIGYLEDQVNGFFADANLTDFQKQKLKAEMEMRITDLMQLAADHVNGDIDGEQVYESVEKLAVTARANVAQLLDTNQLKKMDAFEHGMVEFNRNQIISNEMTTLRLEMNLDPEQERLVRPIVEERYRRVQGRISTPIPNFFFKPIRRKSDTDIYAETSKAVRQYLRPDQQAVFDLADAEMATAIFEHRRSLVPKPKTDPTSR